MSSVARIRKRHITKWENLVYSLGFTVKFKEKIRTDFPNNYGENTNSMATMDINKQTA